jgi:1L-myo-inositol 1-phosphate cytidylyltransferase
MLHVPSPSTTRVREAIVLAAGNGDRFRQSSPRSKLLTPIAGTPLLSRTLESAYHAGITTVHLIVGYDADRVAAVATSAAPPGLRVHPYLNRDWRHENGVSLLAARACLHDRPFALLMGDHLFDPEALRRLLSAPRDAGATLLCVDRRPVPSDIAQEATRVRMSGNRITAIGKDVQPYDALDTGLFVCDPSVFAAVEASCRDGDTTLSGGIRRLTAAGRVFGVDIGDARWCDVDTIDDVRQAEEVAQPACPV